LTPVVVVPAAGPVVVVTPVSVVVVLIGTDRVVLVVTGTVVVVAWLCLRGNHFGSFTGVRNTMITARPARQTRAMASALPLC